MSEPVHSHDECTGCIAQDLLQPRAREFIRYKHDTRFNHHHVCNDEYEECRLLALLPSPTGASDE